MKKISIVFDANPLVLSKSGVGYFTERLIRSLAEAYPDDVTLVGYYFDFLGLKKPQSLPTAKNIEYRPIKFFPTKLLNILRRMGLQLPLELFVREDADVVLFPNFVSMPTLRKPLRVVAVHDLTFIDCPEFVSARNRAFLSKWVPVSVKTADIVLAISEFTKARIIEEYGVADKKIQVVHIPPAKMAPPDEEIIRRYKLERGYILFVGNIEPRKNILGLLNAYEQLPAGVRESYPLVLVGGKGWNDEEILERIATLQAGKLKIIQTGYVSGPERSALYKHATLYVQPSHYEGFGMPILEAMSQGKPVACSNLPVFHEVAGKAAVFFDQDNPADMSETIGRVLEDPQVGKRLVAAGNEQVTSYPAWRDIANDFYALVKHPPVRLTSVSPGKKTK